MPDPKLAPPTPTTATIELAEIGEDERSLLDRLAQLYEYDFTEFTQSDVRPDGTFGYIDFGRFFAKRVRHGYIVRVDDQVAGFALVCEDEAFRDPTERIWWMEEFFVLRKYRRRGVGEWVATALFDRFGGTWEVGQMAANTPAQTFWRKVISRYTDGDFEEFEVDNMNWSGPVQYFRAQKRAGR